MKPFFLRSALALLVASQLLVSCSKESDQNSPQLHKAHSQNEVYYGEETDNSLGEMHNQGLDYFLDNSTADKPKDQVSALVAEYVEEQGYDAAQVQKASYNPLVDEVVNSGDPAETMRQYYTKQGMTQELDYFNKMADALAYSDDTDTKIQQLELVEEAVSSDASLGSKSQASLLRGLAVAKGSTRYWDEINSRRGGNPWTAKYYPAPGTKGGVIIVYKKAKDIAIADACGALSGAIGGGWLGALIGAITSSVMYSLP